MKTKLFENVGGNKFKLLTESMNPDKAKLIREGLKKVFANTEKELSYDKVQNFGLGFIKDVSSARKCALQEARDIAPTLGFADHPETGTFVKEVEWHDEESYKKSHGDTHDNDYPEGESDEKREVQIGKEILELLQWAGTEKNQEAWDKVEKLAQELIDMHSPDGPVVKPGTGGKAMHQRGSVY
jgi:hypothetical protein